MLELKSGHGMARNFLLLLSLDLSSHHATSVIIKNGPWHGPISVLTLVAWWLLRASDNDNKNFRAMPWPDFSSNNRRLVAAGV